MIPVPQLSLWIGSGSLTVVIDARVTTADAVAAMAEVVPRATRAVVVRSASLRTRFMIGTPAGRGCRRPASAISGPGSTAGAASGTCLRGLVIVTTGPLVALSLFLGRRCAVTMGSWTR